MEIVPVSEVGEDWASRKPPPKAPGRCCRCWCPPCESHTFSGSGAWAWTADEESAQPVNDGKAGQPLRI